MRCVYEAEHVLDAHLVRDALERQGVRGFVVGESLTGGIGLLPTCGLVSVMVADPDVVEATRIIAEFRAALSARAEEPHDGSELAPKPA
jgi:hypothetical protein